MNKDEIKLESQAALQDREPPPRRGGKRSLLVFFSVLAALAMLIGLNMN